MLWHRVTEAEDISGGGGGVVHFDRIFFILAGNEDIHKISNEFGIRSDRTKDCGVNCP